MISAVADATENRREIGIRGLKATANLMRRDAPQNCFHSSTPSITPGQAALGLLFPSSPQRSGTVPASRPAFHKSTRAESFVER
jgi:hypothetical protein